MLNRHEIGVVLWWRCAHPVRSALLASAILRRMVATGTVLPWLQTYMLQNALVYEQYAVKVQTLVMQHRHQLALRECEKKLEQWTDMTLTDLAVHGLCEDFLESCCEEALAYRKSGDLDPYCQDLSLTGTWLDWVGFQLNPDVAFCISIIFNIFTLGIFAPMLIRFTRPPLMEGCRLPTQVSASLPSLLSLFRVVVTTFPLEFEAVSKPRFVFAAPENPHGLP